MKFSRSLVKICFGIIFITNFSSCDFAKGTMGSSEHFEFKMQPRELSETLIKFISRHPQHQLPNKWIDLNDWEERGMGFLDGKNVYFSNDPEEIYFVTTDELLGQPSDYPMHSAMSVRAVSNGSGWTNFADLKPSEQKRVESRFELEIVSKILEK